MTQAHYEQLYELSKSFFYNLEGIDEDYVSFVLINKAFFLIVCKFAVENYLT